MSMEFSNLAGDAAADGVISAEEILALRKSGWGDGELDPEEAEALFLANDTCTDPSDEWCDFFVEALTHFVVDTVHPRGFVDEEMAEELIARIDRDGRVGTRAELELLVKVCEKADNVPERLKAYVLKQIEEAVVHGDGPTRHGALDPKGINAAECTLLRRLLFAPASDRPAAVSKREAEMLFRIKDATLYEPNAPEWEKLFVQGVGNFLMGFGGSEPLSNERAAELEQFMRTDGNGVGSFLYRMATSKPDVEGFASLLKVGANEAHYLGELDDQAEAAATFEPGEQSWLHDMLEADEELDDLEKALIAFIDAETGESFVPRH